MYLGSFEIDDTCVLACNAHTPSTGAAVDADAVPGYRIYEDETATPILTGSYALLDDANTVGFYSEQITLSAANGFEYAKSYTIRTTIVVGGVTGVQIDRLQIGAKVDIRRIGGATQSATDAKDFFDDGYDPSTNKVEGVKLADTLTTYTGNTPQTGDGFARMGVNGVSLSAIPDLAGVTTLLARLTSTRAGYLDNLSAGAAALQSSLAALIATVGVAGAGLTAADDAVLAAIAALNNLSQANVRTAIGMASANLDTQLDALPTNAELATALAAADDAILAAIAALNNLAAGAAMTLTEGERNSIATALLDLTDGVEVGISLRSAQRVQLDAAAGKTDGFVPGVIGTGHIRNIADAKNRVTATYDANGNRTSITLDLT